ncbi:MAG: redoxin domain-containing protein, partial [Deltaproteobacteria bacterium]|nr:redoxin domain-containing protein [Deltaproteobacteria bacterium]
MKKLSYSITIICLTLLLSTACGYLENGPEVGKPAPDFTLVDRKGKTWNLAQLKGQVVFVNFWATWCLPCLTEMPS